MPLLIHHLQVSQSERILWLCEELGVPYELKLYQRSPLLSPPELKTLHPLGAAPIIEDGPIKLAETGAIVDYILNIHAPANNNALVVQPSAPNYADYLYWLHFANGTLQPAVGRVMTLNFAGVSPANPIRERTEAKMRACYSLLDSRVGETGAWLAGEQFTVADVMMGFSLTTMRRFVRIDLAGFGNLVGYLGRMGEREGYVRAMGRGDPEVDVGELCRGEAVELFGPLRGGE